MSLLRDYYFLTKPGIVYGNAITATAGFFLASKEQINWLLFFSMLVGLSFIIASACVFNNYIDQSLDAQMERTKNRALIKKTIRSSSALVFGIILGILGIFVLLFYTNLLALCVALIGFFFYVVVYSIAKRGTVYSTIIGSISGAVPPVVGYASVTNHLDTGALILFSILVFWQMPHFYSIALFRASDYKAAHIPVLPLKVGLVNTKIQIMLYIIACIFAASLLTIFKYTGYIYLAIVVLTSFAWLGFALLGFKTHNNELWARKMFRFSLIVLSIVCVMIILGL